ncbi:EpsG family protein [Massilia sp. 2TAF26]|uniref:EpsG family protein n=1 Tax=Massilia sp. 2TAF26 TaxID=3233012 RepID=UPI003F9BF804
MADVSNSRLVAEGRDAVSSLNFQVGTLVLAVIYGSIVCLLPNENFFDHENYLSYAQNAWDQLVAFWTINPLVVFANEPLWLLLNSVLGLILTPEAVVRTIIFVSATSAALKILRFDRRIVVFGFFLLIMPMVIKNYLIHIRQGAALAVFLVGWFSPRRKVRWTLIACAPFIHTSFVFILLLIGITSATQRFRLGPSLRLPAFLGIGIAVGVGLGWVASLVGARQADEYSFGATGISGVGFLFWAIIFLLMSFEGKKYLKKYMFETSVVLFYLGTYFFVEVTARIFESGAVLVCLAAFNLTGWRRHAALVVLGALLAVQWVARLNQPLLGFGLA